MQRWLMFAGLACTLVACAHSSAVPADSGGTSGGDGAVSDAPPTTPPPTTFGFDGNEMPACTGTYNAPTLLVADGRIVIGCLAQGSQNTTPELKFLTTAGQLLNDDTSLLTSDGYYYKTNRLSFHDGKFQVAYEYNCDDHGTWQVGWGWGCIDLREYNDTGHMLTSLQFGQAGLNAHPVIDGSGADLGVAWVSYDDAYFRRLGPDRTLAGGPGANLLLGPDPLHSDARDASRTQIAWDGAGYGVFTIIGKRLYFSRVEAGDHVPVAMKDLGLAYSDTFGGEFTALSIGGTYYVAYDNMTSVVLVNFDRNGDVVKSVVAQAGAYTQPQLVTAGGRLYVITQDGGGRGYVGVFDTGLASLGGSLIGGGLGRTMVHPVISSDGATWAVVYQDANNGNVKLQKLAPQP
jgi:hypothetical protein